MSVKWAISAQKDLLEISEYLLDNKDEELAEAVAQRILDGAKILLSFPLSGKPGRIEETRELAVRKLPYILIYTTSAENVEIVRIIHTSRLFPESLED